MKIAATTATAIATSVAVLGLLGRRHREIEQKFPGLRLKFVETDHHRQLRAYCGKIVILLRFVNHGIVEGVLRYHDRSNVEFVRAGMPELCGVLERISTGVAAGAARSPAQISAN